MATDVTPKIWPPSSDDFRPRQQDSLIATIRWLLTPLASLKLTVTLMAMGIFLVFAGTLAQVDKDVWEVLHQYFRISIARIDLQVFFFRSYEVPGYFYYPGGFLIGGAMLVNLLAAHGVRFKAQAKGAQLVAGLAIIALGCLVTWVVIASGSNSVDFDAAPLIPWDTLWNIFKGGLVFLCCGAIFGAVSLSAERKLERWILSGVALILGGTTCWLLYAGTSLNPSSMRILWQLTKAEFAAIVLLVGCALAFRKRAGIVLLHLGVGMMLLNELYVGMTNVESQMRLQEGQTVNYIYDVRATELAVIDHSDPANDQVLVIPKSRFEDDTVVEHEDLPFNVEVVKYFKNSTLRGVEPGEKNPATAGSGLAVIVEETRPSAGADSDSKIDMASAYVKLSKKDGGAPLGTYLLSQWMSEEDDPEQVSVDGKTYDVALRFKRTYKPYSMKLVDVRYDKYMGTQTAKNYSSDLVLVDPAHSVDRPVHVWMNNPLRYGGETFYQSGFHRDPRFGNEITVLQVVTNDGWMIPYVGCMIVVTGLLAQFSMVLVRFLRHRSTAPDVLRRDVVGPSSIWNVAIPLGVAVMFAGWVATKAITPKPTDDAMQLYEFGKLPVVYEGRIKPLDTLARTSLRFISDQQTFVDKSGNRQPAIKWLLDMISGDDEEHKVFRIENLEVLDLLGLKSREGFRYSTKEFRGRLREFDKQSKLAHAQRESNAESLSVFQIKILELDRRLRHYSVLRSSFDRPRIRPEHMQDDLVAAMHASEDLIAMEPPLVVPPASAEGQWEPFGTAWTRAVAQANLLGQKPNPTTLALEGILVAYAKDDVKAFNSELAAYNQLLEEHPPQDFSPFKTSFECFFNYFEPFLDASILYLVGFVLAALAWLLLSWRSVSTPLNQAAFWLIAGTLALHTFALVGRIYISGRPPVTNLYSAAVFIGWACVALGLILERVYKLGLGNLVAGLGGFATLLIAHLLASSGDTLIVMQAVLDTQFWLATHVTCITLGYATTYVAGTLGVLYVVTGVLTPSLSPTVAKDLGRMIYGSVCFAILFSFFGTVLGGLWADDSWGRFWGWDPKENGALIIVIWNALVLHARWGGMVRDRGLALLAIGGNVVTSWSFFGVNQLGVGKHNYGPAEGIALALTIFAFSQLAIVALGLLPKHLWRSNRAAQAASA